MLFWNISSQPGVVPAWSALFRSRVRLMISLKDLSTAKNALDSLGSCLWMSGALKMLSRYIHCFCTSVHSSSMSEKSRRDFSIFSTSVRIPATKRLAVIVAIVTMLSSRSETTSSTLPRMKTSLLSLKGRTVNSMTLHFSATFFSMPSSAASCVASVLIATMRSFMSITW